ncbi:hypothetical protein AB0J72_36050 [Dactylosporangium sp. NPDC049742]|uniref:hypothetical protein n=1 Tax=Dactylosporangium sp. NPDC049742 TaxID=3154737 RepID=UPI003421A1F4
MRVTAGAIGRVEPATLRSARPPALPPAAPPPAAAPPVAAALVTAALVAAALVAAALVAAALVAAALVAAALVAAALVAGPAPPPAPSRSVVAAPVAAAHFTAPGPVGRVRHDTVARAAPGLRPLLDLLHDELRQPHPGAGRSPPGSPSRRSCRRSRPPSLAQRHPGSWRAPRRRADRPHPGRRLRRAAPPGRRTA